MIFAILKEAADRGELILVENGLLRWHLRKDGVVVIHEVLVLPFAFRRGIARSMVQQVQEKNPGAAILARCPASYDANRFWADLGFINQGEQKGNNEWLLLPAGSSAPMGTPGTPGLPLPQGGSTACASPPEALRQRSLFPLPTRTGESRIDSGL